MGNYDGAVVSGFFVFFYASVQLSVNHTAGLEDRRYCGKGLRERKGWRR